jgi:hypothetical protein
MQYNTGIYNEVKEYLDPKWCWDETRVTETKVNNTLEQINDGGGA